MRIAVTIGLALLTLVPLRAEVFRAQGIHGARSSQGDARSRGVENHRGSHGYRHGPSSFHGHHDRMPGYFTGFRYYGGYGAGYPQYGLYDYDSYGTNASYRSYGSYGSYSGNAAGNGLLLGALAGGIIGHNSGDFGHNGWRGAAWGAGAGWLLGTIADANRRAVAYRQPVSAPPPTVMAMPAPVPSPAAAPVTIINHYHDSSSAMSAANGLFGR